MAYILCKNCGKKIEMPNWKAKIRKFCSKSCFGKMGTWVGRKHKPETVAKLRKNSLWQKMDEIEFLYETKTCREIAEYLTGKKLKYSSGEEQIVRSILRKRNVPFRKTGARKGRDAWNKGKQYTAIMKEKNPRWRGGITKLRDAIRHLPEYREWRNKIFERDNWTCQFCEKRGGYIEADHYPILFVEIMKEYNILSVDDALNCKLFWDISNGRTLCKACHNITKGIR